MRMAADVDCPPKRAIFESFQPHRTMRTSSRSHVRGAVALRAAILFAVLIASPVKAFAQG